jgi:GNAT superfamily N-acetyltransferase
MHRSNLCERVAQEIQVAPCAQAQRMHLDGDAVDILARPLIVGQWVFMDVQIAVDPVPSEQDLGALWESAWGERPSGFAQLLSRSLGHVGAYDGARLIGFVNIAWDGGVHAFILDTCVHPDYRRRGIATKLVMRAISLARERGAHWLHVAFEPHLLEFYRRCGFRHTEAGLLRL